MNIRDSCRKRVTLDMTDGIEQKKDQLMLIMGKLVIEDKEQKKTFKPHVYQSNRGRDQNRSNYQGRFRFNNKYRGGSRYNQNFRGRMTYSPNTRGRYSYNTQGNQRYIRNNNYGRGSYRDQSYSRGWGRSFERQNRSRRDNRIESNSRSKSGSRVSTNRDRIWCFKCGEYDHFAQECPVRLARKTNREAEQIQQMFNINEDQTLIQTLLMDRDKDELTITPVDTRENLNL